MNANKTYIQQLQYAASLQRHIKQTWTVASFWLGLGVTSVEHIGVPFSKHSVSKAFRDFSNPRYFKYCNN